MVLITRRVNKKWTNEEAAVSGETMPHEKCTRRFALTVARNAKFLSSHQKTGQYTAESAIRSTRNSKFIFLGTF